MRHLIGILILGALVAVIFYFPKTQMPAESQTTKKVTPTEERGSFLKNQEEKPLDKQSPSKQISAFFADNFDNRGVIEETGSMAESKNLNWWLNSGGQLKIVDDIGETVQNNLSADDRWHKEYSRNNSTDTDNGTHPQNIFRLVQRGLWNNLAQQAYFQINKLNLSKSPNRNDSNGLFLFNRYQSGDNLYYTGIRVDGAVVIKKKMDGIYYTMAYKKIINKLPLNSWIGLRSEVTNNPNNTVTIKLYTDFNHVGNWTLVLQAVDDGVNYGGSPIAEAGFAGIRTDFMDVKFDDYSIREIKS